MTVNVMPYSLLSFALVVAAFGQTTPSVTAITNAALPGMDAHLPTTLKARSMATIFGSNLSSSTASTPPPWVTTLGGVEIHLVPLYTACETTNPPASMSCELVADLIYVSPTQINFIVPEVSPSDYGQQELALKVVFVKDGIRSDGLLSFYVSPSGDFVVFQVGYDCDYSLSLTYAETCGYSQVSGQNRVPIGAATDVTGILITSQNPIHQGQVLSLWATGLGPLTLNSTSGLLQQTIPSPFTFGVAQSNPAGGTLILSIRAGKLRPRFGLANRHSTWAWTKLTLRLQSARGRQRPSRNVTTL